MKELKEKIDRFLYVGIGEPLRRLSPRKRLIIALTLLGVLLVIFTTVIARGLYRIGRDEALPQLRHIRPVTLPELPDTLPADQRHYLEKMLENRLNELPDDTDNEK